MSYLCSGSEANNLFNIMLQRNIGATKSQEAKHLNNTFSLILVTQFPQP